MMELKEYKLAELCNKVTDGSHFSPKAQKDGYPMFSVKDMLEFGFDYSSCKRISKEDYEKMLSSGCVPQKDDILVAKDGSYLKQIFRCKETKEEAILSSIAIFRPNKDIITPSFLCYLLKSPRVYNYISNNCVSGSALPRIVLKSFKEVEMQIPPLSIQHRIASILSSLDSKIETNNKINAKLEEMAQALFKSWFVDFEPFKDKGMVESELGMIPEGWRVGKAEDFYSINIGKTPPRKEHEWFTTDVSANTWVSISDMGSCGSFISKSSEYLTDEAVSKFNVMMVPKNTILVSFKLTIGRVAIADCELTTNEAIARFMLPKEEYLEYTYLMLKDYNYGALGSTSSIATAVNSKIIKAMRILMPTMEVIKDFHLKINPLLERIRTLQKESSRLSHLRDTLLPKFMSGEIELE